MASYNAALQAQMRDNTATRNACLQTLMRKDPEDVYYSMNHIKGVVRAFYMADQNLDGLVAPQELLNVYRPRDAAAQKELLDLFEASDVTKDQKLSLAEFFVLGFLEAEAKEGYTAARKIKA